MTAVNTTANKKSRFTSPAASWGWWKSFKGQVGRIGKSLMFPIAILPIAAILLRIGAQIPTDTAFAKVVSGIITQGGAVAFDNLPILFAIGVGFGLAKDNRGEAAISAFVGMTLVTVLNKQGGVDLVNKIYEHSSVNFAAIFGNKFDAIVANNVLTGIIAGGIVAYIYNKFNGTELPASLGFFSGRRLIPVLTILSILVVGVVYAILFPWVGWVIFKFSDALGSATSNRWSRAAIMGVYGIINRLLIPFGLHHIPNTLFWFQLGSHPADNGIGSDGSGNVYGDINIFLQGASEKNTAGTFQAGFFPIMMFGLPALAAAFYVMADNKEQKRRVLALFGSAAVISFLSGITEPIEFAFLFVAPALFFAHAFLTGLFGFITGLFGIQLGFGFSAGLLDYILSIPKAMDIIHVNKTGADAVMANPGWIFVIGPIAAATYFFLGKFLIKRFNIATPGRGVNQIADETAEEKAAVGNEQAGLSAKTRLIVEGYGGYDNITNFQNCVSRLRYDVKDASLIDEAKLKAAGAIGVIKVSPTHVQAIFGVKAEALNDEIKANNPRQSS